MKKTFKKKDKYLIDSLLEPMARKHTRGIMEQACTWLSEQWAAFGSK